jgi:hypothetical protein
MDRVYFPEEVSVRLVTTWIPFGDMSSTCDGVLMVVPESHRNPQCRKIRETYGRTKGVMN